MLRLWPDSRRHRSPLDSGPMSSGSAAGNRPRAAVAALLIVGNHYVRNRPVIAAGWFHRGRRLLEDEPEGPAHGVLAYTAALINLARGDPDAAVVAASESQRIGARFCQPDIEAVGQTLHACASIRLGPLREAQAMLDEALAWASSGQLGPIATGQIFCWSTQALLAAADFARAARMGRGHRIVRDRRHTRRLPGPPRRGAPGLRPVRPGSRRGPCRSPTDTGDRSSPRRDHALRVGHDSPGPAGARPCRTLVPSCSADVAFRANRAIALLQFARGDTTGAAASITAALDGQCHDELRRVPLLSAALQIAVAVGHHEEAARHVRELEDIAGRFGMTRARRSLFISLNAEPSRPRALERARRAPQ